MDEILKKMRGPNSIKLCTKLAQYTLEYSNIGLLPFRCFHSFKVLVVCNTSLRQSPTSFIFSILNINYSNMGIYF